MEAEWQGKAQHPALRLPVAVELRCDGGIHSPWRWGQDAAVGFAPHAMLVFEREPCAVPLLLDLCASPEFRALFASLDGLREPLSVCVRF